MSESDKKVGAEKKGLGLFVKSKSSGAAAVPPPTMAAPKNVKRRWIYIGFGVIVAAVVASNFTTPSEKVAEVRVKEVGTVDVTPKVAEKRAFEAQYGQMLQELRGRMDKAEGEKLASDNRVKELQDKILELNQQQKNGGVTGKPEGTGVKNSEAVGGVIGRNGPPAPPTLPERLRVGADGKSSAQLPVPPSVVAPSLGSGGSLPPPTVAPAQASKPMQFLGPKADAAASADVVVKTSFKKNDSAGQMPLGFAPISLLNGIDAGTSQATQSNPLPVLIRLNDNAVLPGAASYKLRSCFALGTGYGDLSAERVYIRVSKLSCVDKNERLVLSQEIAGYVNDSDGTLGMRGKVDDRQGSRLGKALLAGFAQGLAGALGSAQGTTAASSLTGAVTSSISGGAALRASGLSGAQNAANQLAEFYLKEAANIFPVIVVENGRTGTLVLTSNTALQWTETESRYVKDVAPTNNR